MKNKVVEVPTIKEPVAESPGFAKKELSDFKLDLLALCGFGCRYCSSNSGNYLRINREKFAVMTEQQLGRRVLPGEDHSLMFIWPEVLDGLRRQVDRHPPAWGAGQTLVFSMLTDAFSPWLLEQGITEKALELIMTRTSFRVRVLTKSAAVGTSRWVKFFSSYPGRFVVGLSTGTLDDEWARRMEIGTSTPKARLLALHDLQNAGVPTFGMLCPVFPDVLQEGQLEALLDQVRPDLVEHIWAEPYNERINWQVVRDSYPVGSSGREWFTAVYERKEKKVWSRYATYLYRRLRAHAEQHGWMGKLRYLLYEDRITPEDARRLGGLEGILLQSKPADDGRSQNPHIAALQGCGAEGKKGRRHEVG